MRQFLGRPLVILGVWASFFVGTGHAIADDAQKPTAAQASWTTHLITTGHYGDAADAVQSLIGNDPNADCGLQLRGTLALYVGHVHRASLDFQSSITMAPDDPAGYYGLALCALFEKDLDAADRNFARAQKCPALTDRQSDDLRIGLAYVAFLRGDLDKAETLSSNATDQTDSTRQLLLAVIANRRDAGQGEKLLRAFVEHPNGVPSVHEDNGIRMRFEMSPTTIEPSLQEAPLREMYQIRMDADIADSNKVQGKPTLVKNTILIEGPAPQDSSRPIVSFYLDNQFQSMVNSAPYSYTWNTTEVPNGRHRLRIDMTNSAGVVLNTRTMFFEVKNQNASQANLGYGTLTAEEYRATADQVWDALRLCPAYKVAEVLLAENLAQHGDKEDANFHRSIAAAIDPNYKDGRAFMHGILGPQLAGRPNTPEVNDLWQGSINGNRVVLTFDDGPNAAKTPALLDALDKANVPATFFVVGSRAELVPDLLHRMAARGDEIENHSYTHQNMSQALPATIEAEILRNCVLIRALAGRFPRYFRPPGGNADATVTKLTRQYGLINAYWTIDVLHAEEEGSPSGLVQFVMKRLHPGAIILMHNAPDVTSSAIPALVAALHARGYKCVRLNEIGTAPLSRSKLAAKAHLKE